MTNIPHPFRQSKVAIYERLKGERGPRFLGFIEPVGKFPVYFTGETATATMQKAREFIDKEATKLEERAARAAARAPKKAKKEKPADDL